jgi:anti-sigma factor RsiW
VTDATNQADEDEPAMNRPDHDAWRELLEQEIDGRLAAEQQAPLADHLAGCAECRAEHAELQALDRLLRSSQIEVRSGFRQGVMAALPAAGWEARHPRSWRFPVAAFVALLGAGIALLGAGSTQLGSAYGLAAAIAGMLRAALVAGVGFTAASWRWFGMFAEQLLASPMSLAMFAVFVICLNVLLFTLIRRRRAAHATLALRAPRPGTAGRRPRRR